MTRLCFPRWFRAFLVCACFLSACANQADQRRQAELTAGVQRKQRDAETAAYKQAEQTGRDDYVTAHPELSEAIITAIHDEKIVIGMSPRDVQTVIGKYAVLRRRENRLETATGTYVQWALQDGRYLSFTNGVLESIQSGSAY